MMHLPFHPQPKSKATQSKRVKPTQRQMGEISAKVDKQLKARSQGVCERCRAAEARERAHITGRKQIKHKTTVNDLLHLCVPCHRWLDGTVDGIRYRETLRMGEAQ